MTTRKVKVIICDVEQYDGDWPTYSYPTRLADAVAWFQEKLERVPPEWRDTAYCSIDSASGYEDSHYGHIEIGYSRPETASERGERLAREERDIVARREQELRQARAILSRYGENT